MERKRKRIAITDTQKTAARVASTTKQPQIKKKIQTEDETDKRKLSLQKLVSYTDPSQQL